MELLCGRPELLVRLEPYLRGLLVEDLCLLSGDTLVDDAEPRDRAAMRVAVARFLAPYLLDDSPRPSWTLAGAESVPRPAATLAGVSLAEVRAADEDAAMATLTLPVGTDRVVSLCRHTVGSWFASQPVGFRLAISRVTALTDIIKRSVHGNMSAVRGLDLTNIGLVDGDMTSVVALVEAMPACALLKLANNRLLGEGPAFWEGLRGLLALPQVQWVDVTYNAAASPDAKPGVSTLVANAGFDKLVWVYPRSAIAESSRWSTALAAAHGGSGMETAVLRVKAAHEQYYGLLERRRNGESVDWAASTIAPGAGMMVAAGAGGAAHGEGLSVAPSP